MVSTLNNIFCTKTAANFSVFKSLLHCRCSATPANVLSGESTYLTTWSWTGDPSQWFERVIFTANGSTGMAWSTYIDPTLVINCNRVGSAPEVNLQPAINNRRADIEVFYTGRGSGGGLYVLPRYIHPKNMYITIGSALPNGNGNYLHWTTGGSTFYMYDVGLGIFD